MGEHLLFFRSSARFFHQTARILGLKSHFSL